MSIKKMHRLGMGAHIFNPSTQDSGEGGSLEPKDSLVCCIWSSKPARIHTHTLNTKTLSRRKREEEREEEGRR